MNHPLLDHARSSSRQNSADQLNHCFDSRLRYNQKLCRSSDLLKNILNILRLSANIKRDIYKLINSHATRVANDLDREWRMTHPNDSNTEIPTHMYIICLDII